MYRYSGHTAHISPSVSIWTYQPNATAIHSRRAGLSPAVGVVHLDDEGFTQLSLETLPEVSESTHMSSRDFRQSSFIRDRPNHGRVVIRRIRTAD